MSQLDFNKEMGSYLDKKSKESAVKTKIVLKKESPEDNEDKILPELKEGKVHIIKREKTFFEKLKDHFKKEEKPEEEYVPEEEVKKTIEQAETSKEAEDEFDEEASEIERETRHSFWYQLMSYFRKTPEDEIPDDLDESEFEERMAKIEKEEKELEKEEATLEEKEDKIEEKKESLWKRFMASFRSSESGVSEEEYSEMEKQIFYLKEDLKLMAMISTEVMKKLPEKEIKRYKESDEFSKFKEILSRNKLIKED